MTLDIYQLIASIFGILCVYYATQERIITFPFAIVSICASFQALGGAKLYANMALQLCFLAFSIWGWYRWSTGEKNSKQVRKTRDITGKELKWGIAIGAPVAAAWAGTLIYFTNAALPWLDAPLATASIIGQYFMSKKVLQHWLIWIVVDALFVIMYVYSGLYILGILYFVYLSLAFKGYADWKFIQKAQDSPS